MPYMNSKGEEKFTNLEKYDYFKSIADSGVSPEKILKDGTIVPMKKLTVTEKVRYATRANDALKRHDNFMRTTKNIRENPRQVAMLTPTKPNTRKTSKPSKVEKPKK